MKLSLLITIAVLLLVPATAAAPEGSVLGLEATDVSRATGNVAGLAIVDGVSTTPAGLLTNLRVDAAQAYALRWTDSGVAAPAVGDAPQLAQGGARSEVRIPEHGYLDNIQLAGGEHDLEHIFNIMVVGSSSIELVSPSGSGADVEVDHATGLCLGSFGLAPDVPCAGYDEKLSRPGQMAMPNPAQRVEMASPGTFRLTAEIACIDVLGVDLSGDMDLPGRAQIESTGGLYEAYFTRLILRDANITFTVNGEHNQVAWAATSLDLDVDGAMALTGGRGTIATNSDSFDLALTPEITGHWLVSLGTTGTAMPMSLSEPEMDMASTASNQQASVPATIWIPAGLVSLLPLAGIVLAVRQTNVHTTMRDVEEALGAERFGRAARMARRILRVNPEDESAHLGRAIALTKSGQAPKAVAELHQHLTRSNPADGTLHYALSVALMDMGRDEEARAAMATAVERTPALLGDTLSHEGGAYS